MNRPRKTDRHLPPCVYLRHGAYYLVKHGKWTRLGAELSDALHEYARLNTQKKGGMPALIEEALPHILKGKAESTAKQYRHAAAKLQDILAEFGPSDVTPRDIAQIRRSYADTYAFANRLIVILRLVFNYALEEQLVDSNPVVGIKRLAQKTRTRRILKKEFEAIQQHADPLLRVVMDLCYLTGQRISDVLSIKRADLTEEGISFVQQKTGARLVVAWNPELNEAVERAKAMHGNVHSLYLLKGLSINPPTYNMMHKRWRAACAEAGVADVRLHDLRAMAGTEAEAQGVDPQALLGHTDRAMTRRYLRDKTVPLVAGPSLKQAGNGRGRKS